jgi:hypothetical protein
VHHLMAVGSQFLDPLDQRLVGFRHGARLLRWRTDKRLDECRLDQLNVLGDEATRVG